MKSKYVYLSKIHQVANISIENILSFYTSDKKYKLQKYTKIFCG